MTFSLFDSISQFIFNEFVFLFFLTLRFKRMVLLHRDRYLLKAMHVALKE